MPSPNIVRTTSKCRLRIMPPTSVNTLQSCHRYDLILRTDPAGKVLWPLAPHVLSITTIHVLECGCLIRHRYDLILRTDQDAFLPPNLARYRPPAGAAFGATSYASDMTAVRLPAIAVRFRNLKVDRLSPRETQHGRTLWQCARDKIICRNRLSAGSNCETIGPP